MNTDLMQRYRRWFSEYVESFISQPRYSRHPGILLKREHTQRVCSEMVDLGKELGMTSEELFVAEVIALFHDIGRFEQYAIHSSYIDGQSVDHGALGVKLLRDRSILHDLESGIQERIFFAILNHNKAAIAPCEDPQTLLFSKLIRDADKLDIWRLLTDYYAQPHGGRNEALEVNLSDTPDISEPLCNDVRNGRIGQLTDIRNLNDFKILQLGWVFDVYFAPTLVRVRKRNYLPAIRKALPSNSLVDACYHRAQASLDSRLRVHDAVPTS